MFAFIFTMIIIWLIAFVGAYRVNLLYFKTVFIRLIIEKNYLGTKKFNLYGYDILGSIFRTMECISHIFIYSTKQVNSF